jgi:hypothetical protein
MATDLGRVSFSRLLLWFATLLAVVLAAGFVYKVFIESPQQPAGAAIESLDFHQYQAILDFDDSEYTQSDPAEVARFAALLQQYDVTPGVTVTAVEDGCAGGLSTTVTVNYAGGKSADMFIASCGEPDYDTFNVKANDLFSGWRAALSR